MAIFRFSKDCMTKIKFRVPDLKQPQMSSNNFPLSFPSYRSPLFLFVNNVYKAIDRGSEIMKK